MNVAWVRIDVPVGCFRTVGRFSLLQHPHLVQHIALAVDEFIHIGGIGSIDIGKVVVAVHLRQSSGGCHAVNGRGIACILPGLVSRGVQIKLPGFIVSVVFRQYAAGGIIDRPGLCTAVCKAGNIGIVLHRIAGVGIGTGLNRYDPLLYRYGQAGHRLRARQKKRRFCRPIQCRENHSQLCLRNGLSAQQRRFLCQRLQNSGIHRNLSGNTVLLRIHRLLSAK